MWLAAGRQKRCGWVRDPRSWDAPRGAPGVRELFWGQGGGRYLRVQSPSGVHGAEDRPVLSRNPPFSGVYPTGSLKPGGGGGEDGERGSVCSRPRPSPPGRRAHLGFLCPSRGALTCAGGGGEVPSVVGTDLFVCASTRNEVLKKKKISSCNSRPFLEAFTYRAFASGCASVKDCKAQGVPPRTLCQNKDALIPPLVSQRRYPQQVPPGAATPKRLGSPPEIPRGVTDPGVLPHPQPPRAHPHTPHSAGCAALPAALH